LLSIHSFLYDRNDSKLTIYNILLPVLQLSDLFFTVVFIFACHNDNTNKYM